MTQTAGLWMLLLLGALIVGTGLPVWALLIGSASLFAGLGMACSVIDWHVLMAMASRNVGLLENDLLQALPLYVFVGVLLQRLAIADTLFGAMARWGGGSASASAWAALGLGTLIAPMNGSVASSSALLARLVAPRLATMDRSRAIAVISAAATIGVVVPPSLVLILLGDAMMRAHTEAGRLPGFALAAARTINTQDVLHAALLPAALVLAAWLGVAWWQGGSARGAAAKPSLPWQEHARALLAIGAIVGLLAGVFTGQLLAVEAAATAGCALLLLTVGRRLLSIEQWRTVLLDSMNLSGALIALLVGATTFSLVFRAFETDRWLSEAVLSSSLGPSAGALIILLFVAACAWVLDAFEMIFVIIPIMAPALINRLADAQQASVLLLLVLQLSFMVPPMGYAVVMARSRSGIGGTTTTGIGRAVLPYLLAQCAVTASVFAWPALVHQLDAPVPVATPATGASAEDLAAQIRAMSAPASR